IQAMAAVLGGAQSLHTNARDEALALPTEESARIALRTQQIIAYESGVTNTADPVGGSEHIERLTGIIEQGVLDYLKRIDEAGGTGDSLMPPMRDAAAPYVSVGEISDRLRTVFGEYREA